MGDFTERSRQRVLEWLEQHVPAPRLAHILRVEQMAIALAKAHNHDAERAGQAGLMHDLAKYFKPQRLLDMAQAEGLQLDPVDEMHPHLLHADVGALVARDEFGVRDDEVLRAIADHTLGRPGMGPLSCIVFLADCLEPGRGNTSELNHLRDVSYQNLHQGVWMASDYSFKHLLETRRLIHPRTILTRNWFLHHTGQSHAVKRSPQPVLKHSSPASLTTSDKEEAIA